MSTYANMDPRENYSSRDSKEVVEKKEEVKTFCQKVSDFFQVDAPEVK
jgi:hypothetical protein